MPSPLELAARAAFEAREAFIRSAARVPRERASETSREMARAEIRAALSKIAELKPQVRTIIEELLG